jgi:transcriptional antiterminator
VICTNWQLSAPSSDLTHFISCLDRFTQAVCQQLGTSIYFLKKQQPDFLRHIQFLIVRVLKTELKQTEETEELDHFIQQHYPDAFAITNNLRRFTLRTFGVELSNSEQTFLALHIEKCRSELKQSKENGGT